MEGNSIVKNRKPRAILSLKDKASVIDYHRDHKHETLEQIGSHFKLVKSTISKILKERDSIMKKIKTH